ncbi:rho GTPase-activating protein 45-like isoform X2 [Clytia hemisphaerica]|uniref:Uncharacterized protein n=2 Tax=Clytia hemisphaerica TaxID=252671 RepID=A0A7M6DQ33_9CNID
MGSVDQDDIIALTKHVRSFSESLNSLRNTFNDSLTNGIYNEKGCHDLAHNRLSEVLGMLKKILSKYPHLHSQDILDAAKNIIRKIRDHNYSIGEQGPEEYYAAIDQLALSFSSSVSEFVLGDKDSPHSPSAGLEQEDDDHFHHDEEYDPKQYDEDFDKNESEDSLDHNNSYEVLHQNLQRLGSSLDYRSISHDNELTTPSSPTLSPKDLSIQRTDELDKTLRSIEDSVELTLTRTKVWTKYAKDILNYLEKRSHFEADCSKQIAKLAQTTRSNIVEESFLPFQSIFVTALDNDIQFSNNFGKNCENPLKGIIDKLAQRQRDHDAKRSKLKGKWKNELKRVAESRENLRNAKAQYMRKQKELEKFNKLQQEGKDEKGFSIGKKKGQEDFIKSADDSEHYYKQCVNESNRRQQELERMKSESLIELRQLVYQCDMTMKQVTIAYFQMMHQLLNPLPVQYKTLAESCKNYEEGQQFADFVKLQQSTSNQAMCPTYQFEPYRGEGVTNNSLRHQTDGNVLAISSDDFHSNRRMSINSESEKPKQAWAGSLPRNKGSATDDTDSQSSRSLPNSREASPTSARKLTETYSDDESHTRGGQKNQKRSTAAKSHKFKKLRTASKCKECESLVYFNGFECEKCGIICHKKCLEKLAIQCGNKRLPRKMTTFGVDFHQHLEATKRKDIPYIMEKCIDTLDEIGLGAKGLYRVSGVKSKVEKLCQQFETGGHLIDLTSTHQQPQLIASVLKLYLRQLPEPLLTFKLYQPFIDLAKESGPIKLSDLDELDDQHASQYEEVIKKVHDIVKRLPSANFYTAGKLIRHLKRVANHAHENQMSPSNLAIVFGPTLLRPEGDANSLSAVMDMSLQTRAVELLILNDRIFVDETNIIEVTMQEKKFNRPSMRKKRQPVPETVQEVPAEHKRDDSNIASEFSQELLHIKFDSVTNTATVKQTPQLPGQPDNSGDYDNIPGDIETDIAGDLPVIPNVNGNANYNTQTSTSLSDTTDYESAHSRLSSIESLLDDGSVNFNSQSPVELPDASSPVSPTSEEIDDDVWMNQFGKDNKRRSPDSGLEGSPATNVPVTLPLKKKPSSPSSRLETTTYSFSIGSTELTPEDATNTDQPGDLNDLSPSDSLDGLEPFVKRDSKERQPVRGKHLKAVNVKATINVSPEQPSPKSSPQVPQKAVVESTRSVDSGINDVNDLHQSGVSVENNRHPSTASAESEKDGSPGLTVNITQAQKLQNITEKSENSGGGADQTTQKSPTKQGPMTLPKPKKTLDKKSWTADLIKSKTQKIPEQPQPGSLNERLLQQGSVKRPSATAEDIPPVSPDTQESSDAVFPPRSASVGHRSSVRDIRNRFQNNLINNSSPGDDLHESTETEKFV